MVNLENSWDEILKEEFQSEYYLNLRKFLIEEYRSQVIYPKAEDIFKALRNTAYEDVKVVILGQDPYHQPNQANGLAFSVNDGVKIPPSLVNIFKELESDLGIVPSKSGNLEKWSERGVLLLNTVLTVRKDSPASHQNKGWEILTDRIIQKLNDREEPVVFILWGSPSRKKKKFITNKRHKVIEGVHPSPLSAYRGFFGGKYFSKVNSFLQEPIDWSL